jgi:hypothetical protein
MKINPTEFKVKIASLASFAGALAGSVILDKWAPGVLAGLSPAVQAVLGAVIAAVSAWLAGYIARTRPDSISESTVNAAREYLRARDAR